MGCPPSLQGACSSLCHLLHPVAMAFHGDAGTGGHTLAAVWFGAMAQPASFLYRNHFSNEELSRRLGAEGMIHVFTGRMGYAEGQGNLFHTSLSHCNISIQFRRRVRMCLVLSDQTQVFLGLIIKVDEKTGILSPEKSSN